MPGEHDAIIDRELRLPSQAHAHRQARTGVRCSPDRCIFDDRGTRMTPSSAHKQGARYRYYVSAPVLQGRREAAGSVPRVPEPDFEELVIATIRAKNGIPERIELAMPILARTGRASSRGWSFSRTLSGSSFCWRATTSTSRTRLRSARRLVPCRGGGLGA